MIDSLGQSLTKAGSSLQNVVAATVYVKNAADAAAMTEVWRGDLAKGRADPHHRRRRAGLAGGTGRDRGDCRA